MDGPSDGGDGAEPSSGDYYRRHALSARRIAEVQPDFIRLLDKLAEYGELPPAGLREGAVWLHQTMGQAADVLAAQGLAYDEMLAAGGPDDSRAWVEYEAMTRRHAELMPRERPHE
ncbi:hypothetical protein ATK36_3791 [Amycolatopsis sulphurea]|uniref:Excreted virulence factor EspC (Type VII ESX diderm) n=1 Tax=Amycolatopsis sulphurea TaxID=76022 RepID=A0A2A9FBZ6_9PSEU|nr:hypothetical protein [Amycolatopsis sulphurea]PFG48688.1 hypothetical protein ATK36_3791 [Amycolatopsis sulphurea]